MNTRYLITGGFGLIGSALANSIPEPVTILSRSETHKARANKSIPVILKDLQDISPDDVKNTDIIYHCASTVDNYNVLTDPLLDVRTNIDGTIYLLEACKNLPRKPKIIYLSTFFVYGNEYDRTKKPINEDSKTDPLAIYPATKLCTESVIKLYSRLYHIPYLICRLTNVYGEQESYDNKKKGALNYLIMQAMKGAPLSIYKGGNFHRDYVHVDDVVSALRFLELRQTNDIFLVGYGKPVLFKDMIDYIMQITKSSSTIQEVDPPAFHQAVGIRNFVADISKITSLGWKSTVDYKAGVKRVVERYKTLLHS